MIVFIVFLLTVFFQTKPRVVLAQEISPSPDPLATILPTQDPNLATQVTPQPTQLPTPQSSAVVIGGAAESERLNELQGLYLQQLESYRTQEQKFIVAKAQYAQLNTLASQELAVQEARNLIDIRAEILLTYLDMLLELLNQTKGIPLENKSPQLVKLRLLKETVLLHQNVNKSALDRFALDQESTNFAQTFTNLQAEAYYTLSLIRLGRVQHAYDKLLSVQTAVQQDVMGRQLSSSQKAQKERGFEEIDREVKKTTSSIKPLQNEVFAQANVRSIGALTGLTTRLSPVFSGMNQTIAFLQEIRK